MESKTKLVIEIIKKEILMKQFIGFSKIGQFKGVVKDVRSIAKWEGIPEPTISFHGTVKSHGCFEKDTPITLANGERIPISEMEVGTYILSYDTNTGKEVVEKVLKVMNTTSDKEWCKLTFDDRIIVCTKDHKFYTVNRGWVEAFSLLDTDEFITTP